MQDDHPDADALPDQLTGRDNWVVWRYEKRDGDETKVPYDPETGDHASTTDPETWASFEDAQAYAERDDADGVGFVFDADDTLVGVDLDDCRDPETGALDAWARDALDGIKTYTEVSPSGTGLHLLGLGFAPEDGHRTDVANTDGHLEIYDESRYFTVTGDHVEDTPTTVEQVHQEVRDLYDRHTEDPDPADGGSDPVKGGGDAPETGLSDAEVLEKAKSAENSDKFEALWNDSTSDYQSHSEADLALASLLAFYAGGDKAQVDRLFRESGLYREKWERDGYREDTLAKACDLDDYYTPGGEDAPEINVEFTTDGGGVDADLLTPEEVCAVAGLDEDGTVSDLNDRERAATVWELVTRSDGHHVAVRRDNGTLWAYDGGTWTETGEEVLAEAARKALGAVNYGQNVLREMKTQARADPRAKVDPEEWGVETGTVAVENGLLDLDAAANGDPSALRDLHPDDYALAQLPVAYDPDATADEWTSLVEEWAERGRADTLQEFVGYCLHARDLPIHRVLMLVGDGANGKGTFLDVVRHLLGPENTSSVGLHRLATNRFAPASLYGSLANIDDDLSSRELDKGLHIFKKISAGDPIEAEQKHKDSFKFAPMAKQLYAANQVPSVEVSDEDEAFWRRWVLVEFPNKYPMGERDTSLRPRLKEDDTLSGVLNWAIEGRARLLDQEYFTGELQTSHEKRKRWQMWGDSIDQFVSDWVSRDEDADRTSTSDVYAVYTAWCRENGEEPTTQQKLTAELKKHGLGYSSQLRVDGKNTSGFRALAFSDEAPDPDGLHGDDEDGDDPGQSHLD